MKPNYWSIIFNRPELSMNLSNSKMLTTNNLGQKEENSTHLNKKRQGDRPRDNGMNVLIFGLSSMMKDLNRI